MRAVKAVYRRLPNGIKSFFRNIRKKVRSSHILLALGQLLFEFGMVFTHWRGTVHFANLAVKHDIKLHLGCGYDIRSGWVNVDMVRSRGAIIPKDAEFILYDLRQNIPLPDNSCQIIYSSHFWEHLEYETGFRMMQESHRILQSGGIFRIVLPDFGKIFTAYTNHDVGFFDTIPEQSLINVHGAETLLDYVHYAVYQFGEHKCLYDAERTCKMLTAAGFSNVEIVEFDASIDIDEPLRRKYSLYVEALRK